MCEPSDREDNVAAVCSQHPLRQWQLAVRCGLSVFVGIPLGILALSAFAGGILAAVEEWTFVDGLFYVAGNIAGLGTPLTNVSPDKDLGEILDLIISVMSISVAAVVIGVTSNFSFISWLPEWIEHRTYTDTTDVLSELVRFEKETNWRLQDIEVAMQEGLSEMKEIREELRAVRRAGRTAIGALHELAEGVSPVGLVNALSEAERKQNRVEVRAGQESGEEAVRTAHEECPRRETARDTKLPTPPEMPSGNLRPRLPSRGKKTEVGTSVKESWLKIVEDRRQEAGVMDISEIDLRLMELQELQRTELPDAQARQTNSEAEGVGGLIFEHANQAEARILWDDTVERSISGATIGQGSNLSSNFEDEDEDRNKPKILERVRPNDPRLHLPAGLSNPDPCPLLGVLGVPGVT